MATDAALENLRLEEVGLQNLRYLDRLYFEEEKREALTPLSHEESLQETYRRFGHLWAKLNPLHKPSSHVALDQHLEEIYSGYVGVEFSGFVPKEVEAFLIQEIEKGGFSGQFDREKKRKLLDVLNRSELFETFLHTRFPGQKRFSLEGAETLIPMLEVLVESHEEEIVLAMSHRGRLNVLSNILKKGHGEIFEEFQEGYLPKGRTGDVKYHLGYQTDRMTLLPNPSHLESVYPVLEGYTRSLMDRHVTVLPIVIHGDGSISGQGVVYETLQFQKLPGFSVNGTLHIIVNNQIAFTTLPEEGRSTLYCTDIAKAFGCPIFHINGDHPEEAVVATLLALAVREKFGIDVFLDLICYRKYGHNEGDEPAFTQPIDYQIIRNRKSVREQYLDKLVLEGHIEKSMALEAENLFKKDLQKALDEPLKVEKNGRTKTEEPLLPLQNLSIEELKALAKEATTLPPSFSPHPKITQLYKTREEAVSKDLPLDWGTVEMLSYASLLKEGFSVRLAGQDVGRGTFSHRQLRLVDQKTGHSYFPLQHLYQGQPRFDLYNSPLNEYADVGFEYGYSLPLAKGIVIWEAQFGDFANGAEIMFDQYLSAGEKKWGQNSSLILFLPHGMEGQGPEHSSARFERFLTLAAEDNMRIVYPTLPSQLYHLLKEQATAKKPLIVMTPKGLLRHPKATSQVDDLSNGKFNKVILEPSVGEIHTLVLLTGRFFVALEPKDGFAYLRLEQLYPFPKEQIEQVRAKFHHLQRTVWCQEEPENMGAWSFVKGEMPELIYVGRERRASPACGAHKLHEIEEEAILKTLWSYRG